MTTHFPRPADVPVTPAGTSPAKEGTTDGH